MVNRWNERGGAHLSIVDGNVEHTPEHEVFESMLDGWRTQRLSRNLAFSTVDAGARIVRRFRTETGSDPWCWSPADLERFMAGLRERDGLARSTVRNYGLMVGGFLDYVCDPTSGWDAVRLERFGTHPVQICSRANLPAHTFDDEGSPGHRPLTRAECQALFDAADERAAAVTHKSVKGFVPAFRDATMLKVAYAWGLRTGWTARPVGGTSGSVRRVPLSTVSPWTTGSTPPPCRRWIPAAASFLRSGWGRMKRARWGHFM